MFFKDEILNKIFTGASLSLVIRVSGVLLMFVAHALLVRAMGDNAYGVFAYATSVVPLLALIANGGFQISSLRFLHEYNEVDKIALRAGYLRRSFQIPLGVSTLMCLAATAAGFYLESLPDTIAESAKYAAWIIVVFSLTYIAQQALRAMKKIVFSQIFEQIGLPLILIALAAIFILQERALGYQTALGIYGLGFLMILMICRRLVFRHSGTGPNTACKYDTANWIRVSLPLGLVGLSLVFMTRLDIILLGFFVSAEEIALYSVASRIAGLTVFCMAALSAITGPYISEFHHGGKTLELKRMLRKVIFFALLANLLFWLFLLAFGEYLLLAFGAQYVPLQGIMLILAAGRLSGIGLALVGPILTVSGHQKEYMNFLLLMSAVLFVALYFAVLNHGLTGAAIATSVVMALTNIAVFALIKKHTGINLLSGRDEPQPGKLQQ